MAEGPRDALDASKQKTVAEELDRTPSEVQRLVSIETRGPSSG